MHLAEAFFSKAIYYIKCILFFSSCKSINSPHSCFGPKMHNYVYLCPFYESCDSFAYLFSVEQQMWRFEGSCLRLKRTMTAKNVKLGFVCLWSQCCGRSSCWTQVHPGCRGSLKMLLPQESALLLNPHTHDWHFQCGRVSRPLRSVIGWRKAWAGPTCSQWHSSLSLGWRKKRTRCPGTSQQTRCL